MDIAFWAVGCRTAGHCNPVIAEACGRGRAPDVTSKTYASIVIQRLRIPIMCVLLVDDEPLILMVLEDTLRDAGFDVLAKVDAAGAIKELAERPGHFTAVVTDVHMPGELNGIDLVAHVRETHATLPVVVSTARPDVLTPGWIESHRATVLGKPYRPETLVKIVQRLVK